MRTNSESPVAFSLMEFSDPYSRELYNWRLAEPNADCYTCRPIVALESFENWRNKRLKQLSEKQIIIKRIH